MRNDPIPRVRLMCTVGSIKQRSSGPSCSCRRYAQEPRSPTFSVPPSSTCQPFQRPPPYVRNVDPPQAIARTAMPLLILLISPHMDSLASEDLARWLPACQVESFSWKTLKCSPGPSLPCPLRHFLTPYPGPAVVSSWSMMRVSARSPRTTLPRSCAELGNP